MAAWWISTDFDVYNNNKNQQNLFTIFCVLWQIDTKERHPTGYQLVWSRFRAG